MKRLASLSSAAFFILYLLFLVIGCENPVKGTGGPITDVSFSFTVPAHVVGDSEINQVELWINVNPIELIDEETVFTLSSPYGTSPLGFTDDDIDRPLDEPDHSDDWWISLSQTDVGRVLRIKRANNATKINETATNQTWLLKISDFSSPIKINNLDIHIISETWDGVAFNVLTGPNYLAYINE